MTPTTRTPERDAVLALLAGLVPLTGAGRCVLVGVDGPDGSGKTVLSGELAGVLTAAGRRVRQVSIDDFHHPRAIRYARGRSSPEGFYRDSFDLDRFRRDVLDPLGPDGDLRISPRAHVLGTDEVLPRVPEAVPPGTVVVVDGLFLHRPELVAAWDLSVWLDVPPEVTFPRMAARDGTDPDPAHPSARRYVEAQEIYRADAAPQARADVVLDNTDLARPRVLRTAARPGQGRR
ncbi:MAG: uridine kinase [Frankiales bacterium]|nr:uridine kinase [Frankiales bacterium]